MTITFESPSAQRRRRIVIALVAAALVAAGVSLWLASRSADARLYESTWGLESARFEGSSVSIETNGEPVRWSFQRTCDDGPHTGPGCFDRAWLQTHGGCGTIETSVVYEASSVRWTGDAREIAPACVGEITRAVIAVGQSGSFDYSFDGDRLVVTAPDGSAELVFQPISTVGWGD